MDIRKANLEDKDNVLETLDNFRSDCILQITHQTSESNTARTGGHEMYDLLLEREDYIIFLLENESSEIVGIITGYLCPMLRSGQLRGEVEEFFIKSEFRGQGNAQKLMDAFFKWCETKGAVKVNLESDNELERAHGFYEKYGFESKAKRFVKKV